MYNISLITGDGIGPELSESAISILETIPVSYTQLTLQTNREV